MKKMVWVVLVVAAVGFSCATPAQKATGNYNGQFTQNASVFYNISAAVTETNSSTVSVTFSGTGISTQTISGITAISDGDGVALTKTGFTDALSGAVDGNQLSISYSYMSGAITYVGTK